MKKVNLITKAQADEKAQNYFENSKAPSLHITRDGQIFLKGSESFMSMHEKDCKLEKSWHYLRDAKKVVAKKEEPEIKKEKKGVDVNSMSLQALKAYAEKLTKSKKIKKDDWKDLNYLELKKLLKDKQTWV